jgi:NAD(P)-dependent dehydrogenase (short-subunit alcohol dehydrogenase family)
MSGRVVLVTGASSGIGLACADRLHLVGWTVIGTSRRAMGGLGWEAMRMDVDDDASVADGVAAILDRHGRLDAVVTCAGWGLAGAVEHTPIERAKAQFETNYWGSVRVARAALPALRASNDGRLVFMSSIGGAIGIPFQAFYSSSKFALEGYAESLAYEVAPFGVKVTLVQPGNFRTGFTDAREDVAVGPGDPYAEAANRAVAKMADDEQRGDEPTQVAEVVAKVLQSRRPPRRVSVGSADERVGLIARRLLPWRLFERAARSSLGV